MISICKSVDGACFALYHNHEHIQSIKHLTFNVKLVEKCVV